ncbi:hypothetical protein GOODEAATRI_025209 [Goodea atripinnis]|uniref:Uncharacterized protein n=1 Tax=Goodea atripinnis TaxID=208336 RepID=A0ABV0NRG3_9TELE
MAGRGSKIQKDKIVAQQYLHLGVNPMAYNQTITLMHTSGLWHNNANKQTHKIPQSVRARAGLLYKNYVSGMHPNCMDDFIKSRLHSPLKQTGHINETGTWVCLTFNHLDYMHVCVVREMCVCVHC